YTDRKAQSHDKIQPILSRAFFTRFMIRSGFLRRRLMKSDLEISQSYSPLYAKFENMTRLLADPPLFAHYTSIQVLEKILRDEEFWFSNPLFMNDLEEMRFGLRE